MEFSVHKLQTFKLALHILQGVTIFITFCLMIAVFTTSASIDGRPGWFFALTFLTFPALIFLTMTPRFPRTRKLANPYALAAVDGLFCIFWLSAFASVANWMSAGKCGSGCKLAGAEVALGVFIWLFWCTTTAMSVYGCIYYRNNGYLPGGSRAPNSAAMIDPDKEAFSTAPLDDEYAPVHNTDHHDEEDAYPGPSEIPQYSAHAPDTYAPPSMGGGYSSPMLHEENTAYAGYSPEPQQVPGGRAQFPAGNY
ncbi:hypothetical protein BP5796_03030 [Coleophoma crateriformis]|uniref:MARVEL domain-containing protein n=1 Tax=Coleophoma crateriformis TaxID=565419 RepID=A0A3D8SM30_9HELO|nr:hypothetical protein BP5796_03030 [Coleophoma crateriformis]